MKRDKREEKYIGMFYVSLELNYYKSEADSDALRHEWWASLVVQWLRIYLPTQGFDPLVQEDLTCPRATKPMRHNY